jgi:hypothetical protein
MKPKVIDSQNILHSTKLDEVFEKEDDELNHVKKDAEIAVSWNKENKNFIEEYNKIIEKEGLPLEEFRSF